MTTEEFESMFKAARDARQRDRDDQLRREFEQRERELRCQLFNRVREIEQLNKQKRELQGVVERVHDVVHPERSEAVRPERPSVTMTSAVTH